MLSPERAANPRTLPRLLHGACDVMHRLLEKELGKAGPNLSAERITEAISEARLQELVLGEKETYYAKSNTEGDFEAVAKAVGLGVLPRVATSPQVKSALKLKSV